MNTTTQSDTHIHTYTQADRQCQPSGHTYIQRRIQPYTPACIHKCSHPSIHTETETGTYIHTYNHTGRET